MECVHLPFSIYSPFFNVDKNIFFHFIHVPCIWSTATVNCVETSTLFALTIGISPAILSIQSKKHEKEELLLMMTHSTILFVLCISKRRRNSFANANKQPMKIVNMYKKKRKEKWKHKTKITSDPHRQHCVEVKNAVDSYSSFTGTYSRRRTNNQTQEENCIKLPHFQSRILYFHRCAMFSFFSKSLLFLLRMARFLPQPRDTSEIH